MKKICAGTGLEINGVLGMDFLRNYVIRVDFDAGRLTFAKKVGPKPGEPVTLNFDDQGRPSVWVTVTGWVSEPFLIDTGANGPWCGSLSQTLFKTLVNDSQLKVVSDTLAGTFAGRLGGRVGQGKGLGLAEFMLPAPVFDENPSTNLLGLGYFSRYTVTFDFPNRVMYLQKGKRFDEPEQWNRTGLRVQRQNGKTVVYAVEKGTPAAISGVRVGDVVISIAGKGADKSSFFVIGGLLCSADKTLRVTVQRGEKRIEATLMLEERKP